MNARNCLLGEASKISTGSCWHHATHADPRIKYYIRGLRVDEYPELQAKGVRYVIVTIDGVPTEVTNTIGWARESVLTSNGQGSVTLAH